MSYFGFYDYGTFHISLEDTIRGSYYNLSESGFAYQIRANCWSSGINNYKTAIYNYGGAGNPTTLVAQSEEVEVASGGPTWYTFTLTTTPLLTAGTYYLVAISDGLGYLRAITNGSDKGFAKSSTYPTFPNEITGETPDSRAFCIVCDYTTPKGDLIIYYDSLNIDYIDCKCSRWDVDNYNIVLETWLTKSQLQTLRDNIRPGATDELYKLLGRPKYVDKTWTGDNTLRIVPNPAGSSTLNKMRNEKLIFVKNISDSPIKGDSGWINVKIEGYISGMGAL